MGRVGMTSEEWFRLLTLHRAIAVIRSSDPSMARSMAHAVIQAGMVMVEITWNTPKSADLIRELTDQYSDCVIGTGTILSQADLHGAIAAGAQFAFSPHTHIDLIQSAYSQGIPMIPGALSPTEIVTAWQAGATTVKVFPIKTMGGEAYLRCLRGPLGHIPLIPSGGITIHNAVGFLNAGAIAIGISSHLFPKPLLEKENWSLITERAAAFVKHLKTQMAAS